MKEDVGRGSTSRSIALALIPTAMVGITATWATITDSWDFLGVPPGADRIADLRVITVTAICVRNDPNWSLASISCNPLGATHYDYPANYNYPSIWVRTFAALGLTPSSTQAVALLIIALFTSAVFIVSFLSVRGTQPTVTLSALCLALASPPIRLGLERGNIDLIAFTIVVLAGLASIQRRGTLAAILLAVASVAKFFPAGASLLLIRDRKRRPLWVFSAVAIAGLAMEASELTLIGQRTPQPIGAAFGASLFFQAAWNRFNLPYASIAPRLLGALAFFAVLATLYALWLQPAGSGRIQRSTSELVDAFRTDRTAATLVLMGGGPLITSYLLGTNYDYRLVFAIPLVAGLSRLALSRSSLARGLMVVTLIQLWLTYRMPMWIQLASDLVWLALAPAIGLLVLRVALTRAGETPTSAEATYT